MSKLLFSLLAILLIISCEKQISTEIPFEEVSTVAARVIRNVDICHYVARRRTWQTITIDRRDLQTHLLHGDIVPDADGDGYTKVNPCGNGGQDDCDDTKPAIHPRADELCNGIDDNCDGIIDERCTSGSPCDQIWMLENLNVSTYRNGDLIPEVTNGGVWATLTTGAWCYYDNNPANGPVYGKLYNWYAVNDPRGLAPVGYHIPTDAEWRTYAACLGGEPVAGGKMKEIGILNWLSPNTNATNSSGFKGLPGGNRGSYNPAFSLIGADGIWWSSTPASSINAFSDRLTYNAADLFWGIFRNQCGFSVRCIKN